MAEMMMMRIEDIDFIVKNLFSLFHKLDSFGKKGMRKKLKQRQRWWRWVWELEEIMNSNLKGNDKEMRDLLFKVLNGSF